MTADWTKDVRLLEDLSEAEGFRSRPYRDTKNKLTIGYGRNLDAVGINRDEAEYLKKNDILRAVEGLNTHLPWWANLDVVRQRALVELAFNMGIGSSSRGLLSFRNALPALQRGDYEAAAAGFRNSKWAKDVGPRRTKRITNMLQFGDAMSESSESATS